MSLTPHQRQALLTLARESILHGLNKHSALTPAHDDLDAEMLKPAASFVTLFKAGKLRGCIGTLEPVGPLADGICRNAFSAAFRDNRFPSLDSGEYDDLEVEISILGQSEAIPCTTEQELLAALEPELDGLILEDGYHRATFLPSVWEQLPEAEQFLAQLKKKAGLRPDYWSDTIQFRRYRVESFH